MLGDIMSIYKKRKNNYPNFLGNRNIGRKKHKNIQNNSISNLDDFVGKYEAVESINCVDLKHKFKNGEI